MKTYSISFSYSKDGKSWTNRNTTVKASSESGAITQLKSMYPYVRSVRIMSVR